MVRYVPFVGLLVMTAGLMGWQVCRSESPLPTAVWLMACLGVGLAAGLMGRRAAA